MDAPSRKSPRTVFRRGVVCDGQMCRAGRATRHSTSCVPTTSGCGTPQPDTKASGVQLACGCSLRDPRDRRRVDVMQLPLDIPHRQQTSAGGEHVEIRVCYADGCPLRDMYGERPVGEFAEDVLKLVCVPHRKASLACAFRQMCVAGRLTSARRVARRIPSRIPRRFGRDGWRRFHPRQGGWRCVSAGATCAAGTGRRARRAG